MPVIVTPVPCLGVLLEPYDPVYPWQEIYRGKPIKTTYKDEGSKLLTILDLWPYFVAYL